MTDPAGVAETYLFADLSDSYPEVETWDAMCIVYRGGYNQYQANPRHATELDLGIMRRCGDSFLNLEGVSVCTYPTEITIEKNQQLSQDEQSGHCWNHQM